MQCKEAVRHPEGAPRQSEGEGARSVGPGDSPTEHRREPRMSNRNRLQAPCEAKEEGVVSMERACGRRISSRDSLESSVWALERPSSPMEDRNSALESASGLKK